MKKHLRTIAAVTTLTVVLGAGYALAAKSCCGQPELNDCCATTATSPCCR